MLRTLSTLPLWLVVGLPLALWAGQLWLDIITPSGPIRGQLYGEGGPHETIQAIILFLAIPVAFGLLRHAFRTSQPGWYKGWLLLALLGCLYVGGEEISWGQWIFHWQTPAQWASLNDQGETNLHNTSTWLDQKPRLILELGVIFGGLVFPLLRRSRSDFLPKKFTMIYPADRLCFVAFLAEFAKWGDAFFKNVLHQPLFERASEVQELYFFLFVLFYLISLNGVNTTRPSHNLNLTKSATVE